MYKAFDEIEGLEVRAAVAIRQCLQSQFRVFLAFAIQSRCLRSCSPCLGGCWQVAWNQVKVNDMVTSPSERERLFAEIRVLKQLKHKVRNLFCF